MVKDINVYEKISDTLCFAGNNAVLKFNVNLGAKDKENMKRPFHSEYSYRSDKYINHSKLSTITRNFDYYVSIENFKQQSNGIKETIHIKIQDILYVREQFKLATRWFRDKEFENLFAMKEGRLIMLGKVEPIKILGLTFSKSLAIEPIVINYEDRSITGVRIYLSSLENFTDMSVDSFMGIVYLLDSINMYESAQLLLNYFQRPELGTNMYSMDDSYTLTHQESSIESKSSNRTVKNAKKQSSFFDKMKSIE